jgi:hypothetical protein
MSYQCNLINLKTKQMAISESGYYNPHDFTRHSGVTGEHISDIVQRYPDKTFINGSLNTHYGRMSGALYHSDRQIYFLHDSEHLHGGAPPHGIPPPFRWSYYIGCSLNRDFGTIDPLSFGISSVSGPTGSSTVYHIRDFTPQIPAGYLMRGTICLEYGGKRIDGYLYKTLHPGSKTDGDFYFLHEASSHAGDKPTEGIPSGVSSYSWSLGEKIKWGCCDPNSFIPTTGLSEHPTSVVMGSYVDHSEVRRREERAREMDRERERARLHISGGSGWVVDPDKVLAVDRPVKEVEKEEPVLFKKHVTKKKSCDVLPMQAAMIIKTSKTNK